MTRELGMNPATSPGWTWVERSLKIGDTHPLRRTCIDKTPRWNREGTLGRRSHK